MPSSAGRSVFIHVGAPKSGTTYLQQTLWDNRALLREHGVLYPGSKWWSHVYAALDLRRVTFQDHANPEIHGSWNRLADEVRAWPGRAAIIDQELLAAAGARQAASAVREFDPAEVHVVYTVRDMARVLPAAWQEWVRNREVDTFAEFLAAVQGPRPDWSVPRTPTVRMARQFWAHHDAIDTLAKWGAELPPENVHVITVPQSGAPPTTLWDRFADLLGIADVPVKKRVGNANPSMSAAATSVLRDLNASIGGERYPWSAYDRAVKHNVAFAIAGVPGERIELPESDFEWAVGVSANAVAAIRDAGYDVRGDLDELLPVSRPRGVDPAAIPDADRLPVTVTGLTAFAWAVTHVDDHQAELENEVRELRAVVTEHRELPPIERIKRCLVELSAQVTWLKRALDVYRRLRRKDPAGATL